MELKIWNLLSRADHGFNFNIFLLLTQRQRIMQSAIIKEVLFLFILTQVLLSLYLLKNDDVVVVQYQTCSFLLNLK